MTTFFAQTYSDSYYTYSTSNYDMAAVMAAGFVAGLWIGLIGYLISAVFLGKVFRKAGQPMWKAWVPIYNSWTLLELGGQKGIWAVVAIIPVVNIVAAVFLYIAMYYVGKKFGKSDLFVLWGIFLPIVWLIWLAVDNSTWKGAKSRKSSANS